MQRLNRFFRSFEFTVVYWAISILYLFMAALSIVFPGRFATRFIVKRYALRMTQALKVFARIDFELRGIHAPKGAFILAPKHQSWGDGFLAYNSVDNLTFVTNDHLEKIPLLKGVLAKLGAIVVNNMGGDKAREDLMSAARRVAAEGRRILIYPEGHLSKPRTHHRYRLGIYKMYQEFNVPVVPAATNLGLYWQQTDFTKYPGTAILELLEPIPPGLAKQEFMQLLEQRIETATARLYEEATGEAQGPSRLVHFKGETRRAT
jgi:1-acyl-sn-glycerol-3-phosphate acyltransferase